MKTIVRVEVNSVPGGGAFCKLHERPSLVVVVREQFDLVDRGNATDGRHEEAGRELERDCVREYGGNRSHRQAPHLRSSRPNRSSLSTLA